MTSSSEIPGMPGIGSMTDTFEFMKKMWGGMSVPGMNMPGIGIPGMVMPTLSTEEINKQITDLKAIQSWLDLNMKMLQGTIQALEVQSATLSTLQTMSDTFKNSMQQHSTSPQATKPEGFAEQQNKAAPKVTPETKITPTPVPADIPQDLPPFESPFASAQPKAAQSDSANPPQPADQTTDAVANPAAWWNMMQDQFKQTSNPIPSGKTGANVTPAKTPTSRKKKP